MSLKFRTASLLAAALCFVPSMASAQSEEPIVIEGHNYVSWEDFVISNDVEGSSFRCSTPSMETLASIFPEPEFVGGTGGPGDCTVSLTNPDERYAPGTTYEVKVVVHILMNDACTQGVISDELVASQMQILNEDFQAIIGSNGEPGTDVKIQFTLADTDPQGQPTTGITRTCNTSWFQDNGTYYDDLNWDPNTYMNIYTNTASGNLGYVPFLPMTSGGSLVGTNEDRVVNLWSAFGLNSPIGPPFHLGRTVTHEVGHYLGLPHTFSGGCGSDAACYTTGDLICDTNAESSPHSGCNTNDSSCGSLDPVDNYMDYSDDICMEMFTQEQARRMRCAIEHYRPNLFTVMNNSTIFENGFESGDLMPWSATMP